MNSLPVAVEGDTPDFVNSISLLPYRYRAPVSNNLLTTLDEFSTNFEIEFELQVTMHGRIGDTRILGNILHFVAERRQVHNSTLFIHYM